jgi:uncharacterized membrane protein
MSKNPLPKESHKLRERELVAQSYQFSGPIPPPGLLNQYDVNTRRVIVDMASKQSQHRQAIEKAVIKNNVQNEKVGMWISATITMLMMLCGTTLLLFDKPIVGFLAVFAPACFVAGNYVYHKYQEKKVKE